MGYRTEDARKEFDRWSANYDKTLLQTIFFEPSHRMLLEAIGDRDERILDIGCGTGQFASRVLGRFPKTRVWGLDLSECMLLQGNQRCRDLDGRYQTIQGDSQRLPFADDSFDVVTCSHSFHHYPRQDRVVAEMHRVLRPGGRLMIIDGDKDRVWGKLIFDVIVVLMEGQVRHLSGLAFRELYKACGFGEVAQRRRRGALPFILTEGRALKPRLSRLASA